MQERGGVSNSGGSTLWGETGVGGWLCPSPEGRRDIRRAMSVWQLHYNMYLTALKISATKSLFCPVRLEFIGTTRGRCWGTSGLVGGWGPRWGRPASVLWRLASGSGPPALRLGTQAACWSVQPPACPRLPEDAESWLSGRTGHEDENPSRRGGTPSRILQLHAAHLATQPARSG